MTQFHKFYNDDHGATAIEYGIIAAGIAVAIVVAINSIGDSLSNAFSAIDSGLGASSQSAPDVGAAPARPGPLPAATNVPVGD